MNNSLKISLLAMFLVCVSSTFAENNEVIVHNANARAELNYIAPKTISLIESDQTIHLTTKNGFSLILPKVEKQLQEGELPFAIENLMPTLDNFSLQRLEEQLLLKKEMDELSTKLGIQDVDPKYISLYRETVNWLGTKYRRGGMSKSGVDCSGFTNIIYNQVFDKKLPRVSTDIANNLDITLPTEELVPGDLVFFCTRGRKRINHVGVYLGDGHFVHASIKKGVVVTTLTEGYYSKALRKAGRIE